VNSLQEIMGLAICGNKSRFDRECSRSRLPATHRAARLLPNRAKTRPKHTGVDEVNSVSYLPATFTTLFFLAASLLLGLMR
jgi:hypothetical protein